MPRKQPDPLDIEVGRRLRELRLQRRMSQGKLGQELDVTFQQIQKYEKGTNRIGAGRLMRIAQIFGVPLSDFYSDGMPAGSESENVSEAIEAASALRLLRAYSQIRSPSLQRALTTLAEEIVGKS
jgi:transcriptional regulator with XRE-family HTH domain